jgi:hypothetical protein
MKGPKSCATLSRGLFARAVSQFWPLPPDQACYPCLVPPALSPLTILSPPPSHVVVFLSFFSLACESSSQVKNAISQLEPYHSRLSLCIQLDSPACPFERLVKNHDVRQRRLSYISILLCFRDIAPIALPTRHATLFRRSHLVSRSLVTLLHPKSLQCRIYTPRPSHV